MAGFAQKAAGYEDSTAWNKSFTRGTSSVELLSPDEEVLVIERIRGGRFSDHFRKTVATTMFVR